LIHHGTRRRMLVLSTAALLVLTAAAAASLLAGSGAAVNPGYKTLHRDLATSSPGTENGGAGGESAELATAAAQFAEARTAPGIVAPGAYGEAYNQLTSLPTYGTGTWADVTKTPKGYDADDPDYRDWYSNSSGGAGLVTGRITGLAADDAGHVYAASAVGGVWRSSTGGGNWEPIADTLPSLSSGDLQLEPGTGALWFATGEANTGSTTYVGSGVYRLASPTTSSFTPSSRVGGNELESSTINAIRFAKNDRVWIATLRGVYWHEWGANADYSTAWHFSFAPNPSYLPGGANAGAQDAAYKNIVSDVAIDPNDPNHILAGGGWKGGDPGNGFYETTNGGATWQKINPQGGLDATDIGTITFAYSANGKQLYAMNQSPKRWNNVNLDTVLDGVYVSTSGLAGPWNKIASPANLGNAESGSALAQSFGIGYRPGIQAWYNQFLLADPRPSKADHVFVGLEEVYETQDAGRHWATVGPYWNFYFSCWNKDVLYPPNGTSGGNGCPQSTHSDQHTAAVGRYNGKTYLYVGNDGGVYRRPLDGQVNANNNATDWQSLNDGTIDALQYYAVGVGSIAGDDGSRPDISTGDNVLVSGGLQDNGGSLVRPGAPKMVSNFGGDGGDVLVDPNDGCNIVQEYVFLAMRVTQTCANPGSTDAFLDFAKRTTFSVAPPDVNARFIAPFVADGEDVSNWLAGGNSLWYQTKGFGIRSGSEWSRIYTFKNGRTAGGSVSSSIGVATALAVSGDTALAGWCGSCQNQGFTRGVVLLTKQADGSWAAKEVVTPDSTAIPNRYVGGVAIDPANSDHLYVVLNGFSRTFTEGPGAGIGHVYESTDRGQTWHSIDGTGAGRFPDVPSNRILILGDGSLAVATDLGVVYRPAGSTSWTRLGTGLPLSVMLDLELGPDGNIYVASYGRGIWRIKSPVATATTTAGKKR
jgi:hypothetical protein